jgi:hypothetical protein
MRKNYRFIVSFVTVFTTLTTIIMPSVSASAADTTEPPKKPICRIEIDNAHISRHELKFGSRRAVIVKARSICNVVQAEVTLTVNIYKVEKFGHPMLNSVSTDPLDPKSTGKVVTNYKNSIDCLNYKRTKFYGIAYAKALINGKWNYAGRTRSLKTIEINCGT